MFFSLLAASSGALGRQIQEVADVTIDIAGIGQIVVRPAIRDRNSILSDIAKDPSGRSLRRSKRWGRRMRPMPSGGSRSEQRCEQRLHQARRALALYASG